VLAACRFLEFHVGFHVGSMWGPISAYYYYSHSSQHKKGLLSFEKVQLVAPIFTSSIVTPVYEC
jgi:hypothetical protein